MCIGYLCELCKSKYEKKKIIRNYEIVLLNLINEELLEFFFCFIYVKKRLECYCECCKELLCIECIL